MFEDTIWEISWILFGLVNVYHCFAEEMEIYMQDFAEQSRASYNI